MVRAWGHPRERCGHEFACGTGRLAAAGVGWRSFPFGGARGSSRLSRIASPAGVYLLRYPKQPWSSVLVGLSTHKKKSQGDGQAQQRAKEECRRLWIDSHTPNGHDQQLHYHPHPVGGNPIAGGIHTIDQPDSNSCRHQPLLHQRLLWDLLVFNIDQQPTIRWLSDIRVISKHCFRSPYSPSTAAQEEDLPSWARMNEAGAGAPVHRPTASLQVGLGTRVPCLITAAIANYHNV